MNQPKWVKNYIKAKQQPVKEQITILGGNRMPMMNTGTGSNGIINPGTPTGIHGIRNQSGQIIGNAMLDEGEKVISNAQINAAGGSRAVDNAMKNAILERRFGGGKVGRYGCGGAVQPIGMKRYAESGTVTPYDYSIANDFTPEAIARRTGGTPTVSQPITAPDQPITVNVPTSNTDTASVPAFQHVQLPGETLATENAAAGGLPATGGAYGSHVYSKEMQDRIAGGLTAPGVSATPKVSDTLIGIPGTGGPYGSHVYSKEAQARIVNQATGGAKSYDELTMPGAAGQPIGTTLTTTTGTDNISNANDAANQMASIAAGDDALGRALTNAGWDRLNSQAASNLNATAMQIANNPNLTQGMKNTMMASAMRDAGLAQSDFAANMLMDNLSRRQSAIQNSFNMSTELATLKQTLGDAGFNSMVNEINSGMSYDTLKVKYPTLTLTDYNRIQAYGNIGAIDREVEAFRQTMSVARWNDLKSRIDAGTPIADLKTLFPELANSTNPQAMYDGIHKYGAAGAKDYARSVDGLNLAIQGKDWAKVEELGGSIYGTTFDFSALTTDANKTLYTDGQKNLIGEIGKGFGFEQVTVQEALKGIYKSMGKDPNSAEFATWAKDYFDTTKIAQSPGYTVWGGLDDGELATIFSLNNISDFTFDTGNGFSWTGKDGARKFLTKLSLTGGLNSDGTPNIEAMEKLGWGDSETPVSGVTAPAGTQPGGTFTQNGKTYKLGTDGKITEYAAKVSEKGDSFSAKDFIRDYMGGIADKLTGKTLVKPDGSDSYYGLIDGKWTNVGDAVNTVYTDETVAPSKNYYVSETELIPIKIVDAFINSDGINLGSGYPSYWNGTSWSPIMEGQLVSFGSEMIGKSGPMPAGEYKLMKDASGFKVYVNLKTGEKYLSHVGQGENATKLQSAGIKRAV